MNWFQILALVIQELPALETAAVDTAQFIVTIAHAVSQTPAGAAAVKSIAPSLRKMAAPVGAGPIAPAAPAAPVQPTLTPFKA